MRVASPDAAQLIRELRSKAVLNGSGDELVIDAESNTSFVVRGVESAEIGQLCARNGIALEELTPITDSLEDAYMALTRDQVEYRTTERAGVGA